MKRMPRVGVICKPANNAVQFFSGRNATPIAPRTGCGWAPKGDGARGAEKAVTEDERFILLGVEARILFEFSPDKFLVVG